MSSNINPTYFLKNRESRIYPKTASFGKKNPRFKGDLVFKNKVGPATYRSDQDTIFRDLEAIKKVRSLRKDIKNRYVKKVYPAKLHHRLGTSRSQA